MDITLNTVYIIFLFIFFDVNAFIKRPASAADESRALHGQTEQHDAKRGQQFVRGRSTAHSGNDTKVRDRRLSPMVSHRVETMRGVQVFHVEYG